MEKKFKQPVSMKCETKKQMEDIIKTLEQRGYILQNLDDFDKCPYIVTNFLSENNVVSNMTEYGRFNNGRLYITDYNPNLFIAIASMVEGNIFAEGESYYNIRCKYYDDIRGLADSKTNSDTRKASLKEVLEYFEYVLVDNKIINKFSNTLPATKGFLQLINSSIIDNVKEDTKEEKKIIGYKAPMDLFKGRIKKGDIFSEYSSSEFVMYNKNHLTSGIAIEIVKTWEPVYDEKKKLVVKKGDYLYCHTDLVMTNSGEIQATKGKIYFSEIDGCFTNNGKNKAHSLLYETENWFRKATQHEIEEFKKVKIGSYTGVKEDNGFRFGSCTFISKDELLMLKRQLEEPIGAKVTIKGTEITPDLVNRLLIQL